MMLVPVIAPPTQVAVEVAEAAVLEGDDGGVGAAVTDGAAP